MSTETAEKTPDLKVSEQMDGSVNVELPDDLAIEGDEQKDSSQEEHHAEGGDAGGDDHDDQDRPDDTEAIRAARRARRKAKKEYVKQANAEKDIMLNNLKRQNQELMERLAVVERKTHSADLARLDKAVEDKQLRLQYARMKMAEATQAGDGEAMAKAQEMWYEARREMETLISAKEQAAKANNAPSPTDNGRMQRLASDWMEDNSWFDPNGDDEDSQIARVVDQKLVKEGWNPNSQEYWEELDKRLQKRLPHRYTDDTDERDVRTRRPRSVVTGSGRESAAASGGKNTFTLLPEQVRAMKDAGLWDDPEKRNKMIRRYAEQARQSRS